MSISSGPPPAALQRSIAEAFDLGAAVRTVQPLGRGLINDTYLVTTAAPVAEYAVIQRINRRAFPQPELITQNTRTLTDYVRTLGQTSNAALRLPRIFTARDGKDFVLDPDGGFWRALGYIENTVTHYRVVDTPQAEEVGAALGRFHALVSKLDPARLHATRSNFHNTPEYFARFVAAAARKKDGWENTDLKWCLGFAEARQSTVTALEDAKQRGELRPRVIHGDPKLDNFLFDVTDGHVVSLIDLDTTQPGLVQYDVGDCLRSCANPAGESPANINDVHFDFDICRALLTRYLDETRGFLTPQDYAHLPHAIRLIPFELGLRFLTDHLEGDIYFKTEWPGHNLHRALVQFRLTADIEKNEASVRSLISALERK